MLKLSKSKWMMLFLLITLGFFGGKLMWYFANPGYCQAQDKELPDQFFIDAAQKILLSTIEARGMDWYQERMDTLNGGSSKGENFLDFNDPKCCEVCREDYFFGNKCRADSVVVVDISHKKINVVKSGGPVYEFDACGKLERAWY